MSPSMRATIHRRCVYVHGLNVPFLLQPSSGIRSLTFMARTACADCGGKVSTSAEACPHCGFTNRKPTAGMRQAELESNEDETILFEDDDFILTPSRLSTPA